MAGTDKLQTLINDGPVIILVEPQLGENIGMVARAMANFGLGELRLVNPRDGWPSDKARSAASKADHVIDGVQVFDTLGEAIADMEYVFATTARLRDGFKSVRSPVTACAMLRQRHASGQKTAILFGRERFGLSNGEVAMADEIVTFPVNPAFASLNIAQAVLLMSYEWMKSGLGDEAQTQFEGPQMAPARKGQLLGFLAYLEKALDERGYFRTEAKKTKMLDGLRAVFTRPGFHGPEIDLLHGVVRSLDLYSPQNKRGDGPPVRKQDQVE